MNTIEDRLRAAARAAADTVPDGSEPPLRLPERNAAASARWRGRFLARAAPVAAALAVLAVVLTATLVHGTRVPPGTEQAPAPLTVLTPPRYFVGLAYTGQFKSWKLVRREAIVASTASGKALTTVAPPKPYNTFVAVSGAYDDRTFVLAAQQVTTGRRRPGSPTRFYELRINLAGSTATAGLTALPLPVLPANAFDSFDGIALSPDGTRLAVTHSSPGRTNANVTVYDLATGHSRVWPLPNDKVVADPAVETPSWEANGRYLALDVSSGDATGAKCLDCIRLLDTATRAGDLLSDSRNLVRSPNLHVFVTWNAAFITPDGRHVLRSAIVPVPVSRNEYYDRSWIYDYSARSGALIKSLTSQSAIDWKLLWSSPGGQSFIASSLNENQDTGFITAARYIRGHWQPIPLPAQTLTAAW